MSQSVASTIRQVLAVLVSVYGVLTASVTPLHLPVAVSSVLVAFGPLILALEHYLGDPSTGTSVVTTPIAQKQTAPVLPTVVTQITPTVLAPPTSAPNSAPPAPGVAP
jgi:hypothetical protein